MMKNINSDVMTSLFVSLVITTLFFVLVAPVTASTIVSDSDEDIWAQWPWPPDAWGVFGWRTYAYVSALYKDSTPHGFDEINHTAKIETGTFTDLTVVDGYYIFKAEEVGHSGSYTVYYDTCNYFEGVLNKTYHKGAGQWSYSEAPRHAITEVHATFYDDSSKTYMYGYAYASVWRST